MPDPFTATTPGSTGISSASSSKTSASDLPSEPPISFTVVCSPLLVSGGDRFTTELEFHFRKRAAGMGGGVRAMCSVKVEAHVWGVKTSVEPWMMAEAKRHLTAFFPFMSEFFRLNSKAAATPAGLEHEGEELDVPMALLVEYSALVSRTLTCARSCSFMSSALPSFLRPCWLQLHCCNPATMMNGVGVCSAGLACGAAGGNSRSEEGGAGEGHRGGHLEPSSQQQRGGGQRGGDGATWRACSGADV